MNKMVAGNKQEGEQTSALEMGPTGMPILNIEGISKIFGENVALHPTNLSIGSGEFVTLLGPSGCGKTTLLRIVAGLESPSTGRLLTEGQDVTRQRPEHRPFNMVFQSYALFPHLNVFENVAYGLRAVGLGEPAIAAKVDAALEMVGLSAYRAREVDELSGGMSQRVALVRAVVKEPKVLLLDEPLAALDLQLRKRMQVELREIQRRLGTTFILVTHDQEEALVMSDRIVVMQSGRVIQVGRPKDVYRRPVSRFVAGFIGETSLVPCRVEMDRGEMVDVELANGMRAEFASYTGAGAATHSAGLVSIRPEELQLSSPDNAMFRGSVVNAVFTGAATRLTVAVEPGIKLRVVTILEDGCNPGDEVGLSIMPGAGVFVRDSWD
jgi:ABC-type Fe3+/spermidine/putrescine transport system ATPase subunit